METGMEYLSKVSLNKKVRREYMIKISVVGSFSLAGLVLAVYSITVGSYLYALWYIAAFILGLSYTIIRINTVFPTYLAADGEKIVLSVWKNGVMPYTLPEKPTPVSDFVPEAVKTAEIAMQDVEALIIGSRKYLKRNLSEEEYPQILKRLEADRHYDSTLKRMDFVYIRTKDGENSFMQITDFDIEELAEFVKCVERCCCGVQVMTNIPKLVRMRNKIS